MAFQIDFHSVNLWEYGAIARHMLAGQGYSFTWYGLDGVAHIVPSAFMPPGQVIVQYVHLYVFGDTFAGHLALFLTQVGFGVLAVFASGRIAKEIFGPGKAERASLWFAALYPAFVYAPSTFGITSAVLMLSSLFVWSAATLGNRLGNRQGSRLGEHIGQRNGNPSGPKSVATAAITLGLVGGILGFFRSEAPVLLFITLLSIWWVTRRHSPEVWKWCALAFVVMAAVLAPWGIRNAVVFGRPTLSSTSGGFNFYRGHNELATGAAYRSDGEPVTTTPELWDEIAAEIGPDFESRHSAMHFEKAKAYIASQPGREAVLALKKPLMLWTFDWYSPETRRWYYVVMHSLALTGFFVGLRRLWRDRERPRTLHSKLGLIAIAAWAVSYTAIVVVFFSMARFQILLMGVLTPVVGLGFSRMIEAVGSRSRRSHTEFPSNGRPTS